MRKNINCIILLAVLVFTALTLMQPAMGSISFQYDADGQLALNKFINSTKAGQWSKITKSELTTQINNNLATPYIVNQRSSPLCGPIAIVYELINRNRSRYVKIMQSLYENGYFYSNNKYYYASSKLRGSRVYDNMTAADWMLTATLRECANWIYDLDADSCDLAVGIHTPGEMADWTRGILLYPNVSNESSTVYGEYDIIRNVNSAYGAGGVGFLMVDGKVYFDGQNIYLAYPNHWISFAGN